MRDPYLETVFPHLKGAHYDCTSPEDINYNCIAWAAGEQDVWLWPRSPDTHWPDGLPDEETLSAFIALFRSYGYEVCESGELEEGIEKIAIFAHQGKPTHAARQLPDGLWTSKCGRSKDISHELRGVSGTHYGEPKVYMSRPHRGDVT
jgi:hypothetical protein